jgi:hypothetical protein
MRRLASLPERIKLSMPNTSEAGSASLILRANAQPTKPQIPVMKAFMKDNAAYRQTKPNQAGSAAGGVSNSTAEERAANSSTV